MATCCAVDVVSDLTTNICGDLNHIHSYIFITVLFYKIFRSSSKKLKMSPACTWCAIKSILTHLCWDWDLRRRNWQRQWRKSEWEAKPKQMSLIWAEHVWAAPPPPPVLELSCLSFFKLKTHSLLSMSKHTHTTDWIYINWRCSSSYALLSRSRPHVLTYTNSVATERLGVCVCFIGTVRLLESPCAKVGAHESVLAEPSFPKNGVDKHMLGVVLTVRPRPV